MIFLSYLLFISKYSLKADGSFDIDIRDVNIAMLSMWQSWKFHKFTRGPDPKNWNTIVTETDAITAD